MLNKRFLYIAKYKGKSEIEMRASWYEDTISSVFVIYENVSLDSTLRKY